MDTIHSSPLVKAAQKLNNLVKMKKNVGLGKEAFVKLNLETLKSYELELGVTEGEKEEGEKEGEVKEEMKEQVERGRRKSFNNLKS